MADLFDPKLSPNERDNIMRRHPGSFIDQEDSVRCGAQ
jgi:hypothetical protein